MNITLDQSKKSSLYQWSKKISLYQCKKVTGQITCNFFELVQSKKIRSNEADFITSCKLKTCIESNNVFDLTQCNKYICVKSKRLLNSMQVFSSVQM